MRAKKNRTSQGERAAESGVTVDPLPYAGITQVRFQGSSDRSDSQPCGAPSSGDRWYSPASHQVNGLIGLGTDGTEWPPAGGLLHGPVSLIGQGCVSYNDVLENYPEKTP